MAELNSAAIAAQIQQNGYCIIEEVLSPDFIQRAKVQLEAAIQKENEYHHGSNHKDAGMVLLCSLYEGVFTELFNNNRLMQPFNAVLGEGCIVYAYTSSSMPPQKTNYSNRVHVDCPRIIPGYVTNMGATILLDDFTEENGATWFLPGSHELESLPSDDYFFSHAQRLIAKAGTVWFFNARVWHAGGNNHTDQWRHALTINMCRPYMKQRIDIPRAMAHLDTAQYSPQVLQKLGFLAQVPASYDEYYAPPELRKYQQKAE
jgi:ectoine hydroxylase-related dioxygenase (phytanoyl-CoA dioxygenase family)